MGYDLPEQASLLTPSGSRIGHSCAMQMPATHQGYLLSKVISCENSAELNTSNLTKPVTPERVS